MRTHTRTLTCTRARVLNRAHVHTRAHSHTHPRTEARAHIHRGKRLCKDKLTARTSLVFLWKTMCGRSCLDSSGNSSRLRVATVGIFACKQIPRPCTAVIMVFRFGSCPPHKGFPCGTPAVRSDVRVAVPQMFVASIRPEFGFQGHRGQPAAVRAFFRAETAGHPIPAVQEGAFLAVGLALCNGHLTGGVRSYNEPRNGGFDWVLASSGSCPSGQVRIDPQSFLPGTANNMSCLCKEFQRIGTLVFNRQQGSSISGRNDEMRGAPSASCFWGLTDDSSYRTLH